VESSVWGVIHRAVENTAIAVENTARAVETGESRNPEAQKKKKRYDILLILSTLEGIQLLL